MIIPSTRRQVASKNQNNKSVYTSVFATKEMSQNES